MNHGQIPNPPTPPPRHHLTPAPPARPPPPRPLPHRPAVAAEVPLLHVEAGLRSYRDDMPEEANRIETDRVSELLFAPCEHAREVLLKEGVPGTVQVTGDVLADVLLSTRDRLPEGGEQGEYVLATAHRNYNTDSPERLGAVLA